MDITWKHPNNWRVRGFRADMNRVKVPAARADGIALCDAMAAWRSGDAPRPDLALAVAALKHDSMIVTPMVKAALGLILEGDPNATSMLREILVQTPARSRGMLVFHFAHHRNFTSQQIAPLVDDALADRSSVVRVWAVDALMKVDPSGGPARLTALQRTETHKQVLQAIDFALSDAPPTVGSPDPQ